MYNGRVLVQLLCGLCFALSFLWFPAAVHGASQGAAPAPQSVQWHMGMNLRFYIAPDTGKTLNCAPDVAGADKDAGLLPIWSNDGQIVTTKPAVSGPKASLSFRLVSGWFSDFAKFDSNSQTYIKASEPFAVGGNCWVSGQGDFVEEQPCGSDRLFQFYIEAKATPGNMHLMRNADVKHIKVDPSGKLIAVNDNVDANVCVYSAKTGALVTAPPQDFHVPADQITGLIGQKVPPSNQPTNEHELPGCDVETNTNIDCLIARAFNSLPKICETKPHNMQPFASTYLLDASRRMLLPKWKLAYARCRWDRVLQTLQAELAPAICLLASCSLSLVEASREKCSWRVPTSTHTRGGTAALVLSLESPKTTCLFSTNFGSVS
ncbi:uncharacterized protein IWZ02DRAFT_250768 [Phyllosticta citriasiana]|uniref:uncharacterized protein n=1 Tax=Phyllosticta citriasiana TaxID=595635 RepID=UPI0030FD7610